MEDVNGTTVSDNFTMLPSNRRVKIVSSDSKMEDTLKSLKSSKAPVSCSLEGCRFLFFSLVIRDFACLPRLLIASVSLSLSFPIAHLLGSMICRLLSTTAHHGIYSFASCFLNLRETVRFLYYRTTHCVFEVIRCHPDYFLLGLRTPL